MKSDCLYPKNIEKLFAKIDYVIKNEQNYEKIEKINNWVKWYNSQSYKLEYKCKKDEYLKIYCHNNKFALQVWKHNEQVDSIEFNLLSNYYSEYDSEITKIVEE